MTQNETTAPQKYKVGDQVRCREFNNDLFILETYEFYLQSSRSWFVKLKDLNNPGPRIVVEENRITELVQSN